MSVNNFTGHAIGWAGMPVAIDHGCGSSPMGLARAMFKGSGLVHRSHQLDLQAELYAGINYGITYVVQSGKLHAGTGRDRLHCASIHKLLPTTLPRQTLDYMILKTLCTHTVGSNVLEPLCVDDSGRLRITLSDGRRLDVHQRTLHEAFTAAAQYRWDRLLAQSDANATSSHFLDAEHRAGGNPLHLVRWLNTSLHFTSHLFLCSRSFTASHVDAEWQTMASCAKYRTSEDSWRTGFVSSPSDGTTMRKPRAGYEPAWLFSRIRRLNTDKWHRFVKTCGSTSSYASSQPF